MTITVKKFDFDSKPTENNEISINFETENIGKHKINFSRKELLEMIYIVEKDIMCSECGLDEKNPGLNVCGECYHEQIWGDND